MNNRSYVNGARIFRGLPCKLGTNHLRKRNRGSIMQKWARRQASWRVGPRGRRGWAGTRVRRPEPAPSGRRPKGAQLVVCARPWGLRPDLPPGPSKTRTRMGGEPGFAPQTGVFAGSDHPRTRTLGAITQKWAQRQASWRVGRQRAPGRAGARVWRQGPAAGGRRPKGARLVVCARPDMHPGPSTTRVRMGGGQPGPEPSEAHRGGTSCKILPNPRARP
ncbi:MAG: hypothetical protein K0R39_4004 [Symbiobacteriaceae bacterium]|jgi:hypothetical protein|nr:hypothetical protein [Symbiobacteriaceae bacterium]